MLGSCSFLADAPCYTVGEGDTVNGVCNQVEIDLADAGICGSATSEGCEVCTDTLKSDRRTTCQWHIPDDDSSEAYCGTGGCNQNGENRST